MATKIAENPLFHNSARSPAPCTDEALDWTASVFVPLDFEWNALFLTIVKI